MAQVRGVILDVDGTLVDTNDAHAEAWVEALERGGYHRTFDEVRRLIGMGGDNLLPTLIGVEKDEPKGVQLNEYWKEIFDADFLPDVKAWPGTRELVQRMRDRGLKVAIATSGEEKQVKRLLQIARVDDLIEALSSSAQAKHSKPEPDSVEVALEMLGLPAAETMMVGDTPFDVEAATKIGVPLIGLRCGGWSDADLYGAAAVYQDPADLLAHYDESPIAKGAPSTVVR